MTKRRKLTVTIDAQLAAEYRDAYEDAFGNRNTEVQSLEKFMAGFIEDRLAEEIKFARAETPRNSR